MSWHVGGTDTFILEGKNKLPDTFILEGKNKWNL
jgi:hypothetical protein